MKLRFFLPMLFTPVLLAAPLGFVKEGKGPGILLIHGFGGNKEVWNEVAAGLAKDHTVLRVDLPGSGGAAGPVVKDGAADLEAIAKELAALVRREKLTPCLVVGHSMGGPVAALTVLQDAKAFRGLVLVDSFLSSVPASFFEPVVAGLDKDPKPTLMAFYGPMTTGSAQAERLVSEAMRVPIPTLQAYLRAMTLDFMSGRQASLQLPVIQFAAGPEEPDLAKREAHLADYGLKALPHFQVVSFPKAKHWVMWDAPEVFSTSLRTFEKSLKKD